MTHNNEKYLAKIKKLLNLARRSTNSNEAANALSQAQALMRKHSLTETDIDLMEIGRASSKGAPSQAQKIPAYMNSLANMICRAFGVDCYYQYKRNFLSSGQRTVVFFGPNERPEIAAYAFDVLSRQLVKARREFTAKMRRNIKPSTKVARADQFCEGWVDGAYAVIDIYKVAASEKTLMAAYYSRLKEEMEFKESTFRAAKKCRGGEDAADAGYRAGKQAQLHQAVHGQGGSLTGIGVKS
ncbi:TPA: DUF2786 domain-containing protein [Serratia marcescens]|nr:DUF2786 domain-containing protein [Serratia marcescens]